MNSPIYIYGAGGLGSEIKALLNHLKEWKLAGFYDDHYAVGMSFEKLPCLGGLSELLKIENEIQLVLAFGDPAIKIKFVDKLASKKNISFPTLIHSENNLLDKNSISLGDGCIISAGAVLTTHISLGKHTLININATVGHGSVLGDCCSVMPGANLAGEVQLGNGVLVGSGANILGGVKIGEGARIGSGSVVTKDVKSFETVVGIPAKEISTP
jgi:sugar O-acyltransferase (sialic acid O-acetyltransferase NeuD family)